MLLTKFWWALQFEPRKTLLISFDDTDMFIELMDEKKRKFITAQSDEFDDMVIVELR